MLAAPSKASVNVAYTGDLRRQEGVAFHAQTHVCVKR